MALITERLHRYLGDPVVLRVCIFIYGILTFGFGLAFIVYPPASLDWVLIAVGLFFAATGSLMLYTSVASRKQLLEKIANGLSSSELVGVVLLLAVFLIAIPLSYAIKSTRHQRESSKADEGA
jgi:uncharacterized membrane protein